MQCTLHLPAPHPQFVYDALHTCCSTIGTSKFGARAMRACLESQYTTKRQQKHVAMAIVKHSALLATNANGAILINWLLDTSSLPGRYRVLAPKIAEAGPTLCTHKLGSATVLKLVNQRLELDARELIISSIFMSQHVLTAILSDLMYGTPLIQKILATACTSIEEKIRLADRVRTALARLESLSTGAGVGGYKRLLDELAVIPSALSSDMTPIAPIGTGDDVVSPLTPHAPFFNGIGPASPSPYFNHSVPFTRDNHSNNNTVSNNNGLKSPVTVTSSKSPVYPTPQQSPLRIAISNQSTPANVSR